MLEIIKVYSDLAPGTTADSILSVMLLLGRVKAGVP